MKEQKEHDEAIAALKTETINNKTVDTATGEIITEEAPKPAKTTRENSYVKTNSRTSKVSCSKQFYY